MVTEPARLSAYAELVAGLLDVRDDAAEQRFDAELADAESARRIDPETARILRWWQRETVRGVVAHAQTVLPATMLAIEHSHQDSISSTAHESSPADTPSDDAGDDVPAVDVGDDELEDDVLDFAEPRPPVDLTARRLLVAGLTPLRDP